MTRLRDLFADPAAVEALSAKNRGAWRRPAQPAPVAPERRTVVVPAEPAARSKHGARKVEVDGIVFDSTREARWYQRLLNLQAVGVIRGLRCHPLFPLEVNGIRVADYEGDFIFEEDVPERGGWFPVVADAKSKHTRTLPVYQLKRKLMLACHGVEVRELN